MDYLFSLEGLLALLTLTALEIVLGIDNIIVISILVEKLPRNLQSRARRIGLGFALFFRVALLATLAWLTHLTAPLFTVMEHAFSVRDLVLGLGGLFLLAKASTEIFRFVELREDHQNVDRSQMVGRFQFAAVIGYIVLFDMIFSLDSILTAVGLANQLIVMILAVIAAVLVMMLFADLIGDFVQANPGIKMLALSFLVLIGVLLIAEGCGNEFNRGYVYFAMAFSLLVELLNRRRAKKISKKPPS